MVFLDELATNATARNVSIIVYSGNNDLIISHRGSEGALAHPLTLVLMTHDHFQLRSR